MKCFHSGSFQCCQEGFIPTERWRFCPTCIKISVYLWTLLFFFQQEQKPGPYVKEMKDAATFYTNRVLKDYKETYVHNDETCPRWIVYVLWLLLQLCKYNHISKTVFGALFQPKSSQHQPFTCNCLSSMTDSTTPMMPAAYLYTNRKVD